MTFGPRLLEVRPPTRLGWLGHFLVPGVFDGRHSFEIIPGPHHHLTFVQRERFTGVLVSLLANVVEHNTLRSFHEMNAALKVRAEGGAQAP
ncbi:MAG: SRPBCC domain-containing protein [Gemmatimonadetes bacterium]|nr:SRPBCC domain-containing protein [Gemmatimonadota bacterium]